MFAAVGTQVAAAQSLTFAELNRIEAWYKKTARATARGEWGIVVGTMDGRVLWSMNPELELMPASTAKVFTTGFAREKVGGVATVATRLLGFGAIDPNGRWLGSWTLDLGGDLSFERPDRSGPTLDQLAQQLAARGVRSIEGPIALTSRTGPATTRYPAVWSTSYQGQLYAPPIGPVTLHENTVSFTFKPGREAGAPPTIAYTLPAGIEGLVRIGATTVPGSRSRLVLVAQPDGRWSLVGTLGRDARSAGLSAVAHDPTAVLTYAWARALERAGIRWTHRESLAPAPAPEGARRMVLAQVASASFDTLASEVNRRSLNIGAELLLQWAVQNQTSGPEAVTRHVREMVGPEARVSLVDGSGLSELNRMSPLTQVLYLARYPQRPGSERFPLLLPANGTGTLKTLRYGMGRGVVHAKTGTLDRAATLMGYLGRDDGVLVISLMYNGSGIHRARAAEWELFRLLGARGVNLNNVIETSLGGTSVKGDR